MTFLLLTLLPLMLGLAFLGDFDGGDEPGADSDSLPMDEAGPIDETGHDLLLAGAALGADVSDPDKATSGADIVVFDAAEDILHLELTADEADSAAVSVSDWADAAGADVFVNDALVVRLAGGQGLSAADITYQVALPDSTEEPDEYSPVAPSVITGFDPVEEVLEIVDVSTQSGLVAPYNVEIVDWADANGADILLNGLVMAHVTGAQGLDPAQVVVRMLGAKG